MLKFPKTSSVNLNRLHTNPHQNPPKVYLLLSPIHPHPALHPKTNKFFCPRKVLLSIAHTFAWQSFLHIPWNQTDNSQSVPLEFSAPYATSP